MIKSKELEEEDILVIRKQIKNQQKNLILFPFLYIFTLFLAFARNNGKMPEFYFYIITIPFLIIPGIYSPISKGLKLRKIFYSYKLINDNQVQFTVFGTLWRKEQIIIANLSEIKVDKNSLPKLLYKKYLLNAVYIRNHKYYIFKNLLTESNTL